MLPMAIVMVSCGQYQDVWPPFLQLFRKYWGAVKEPCYIITDGDAGPQDLGPFGLHLCQDKRWAKRLLNFCEVVRPETLLLLHEDYFLKSPVNHGLIQEAQGFFQQIPTTACVRLYPCPGADIPLDETWGLIDPKAPYKISCQAAIWRTSYLVEILNQVDTSPEFELKGTPYSWNLKAPLVSIRRDAKFWPLDYYCTAVVQGRWQRGALELCKAEGIMVDTSKRRIDEDAR